MTPRGFILDQVLSAQMRDWDSDFAVPSVLHLHRKHFSRAAFAAASERGGIRMQQRRGAIAADYGGFPIVGHTAWVKARWTAMDKG
jgi:hypothetical protein